MSANAIIVANLKYNYGDIQAVNEIPFNEYSRKREQKIANFRLR